MADALDLAFSAYGGKPTEADPLDAGMHAFLSAKPSTQPVVPAPAAQPTPGRWNTFGNAITKGVAGIGDMIPSTMVRAANLGIAAYGAGKHLLTGSNDFPELMDPDALSGFKKIGQAAGVIRDEWEPTDSAGRVLDFTGQVVGGGGVNPRAIVKSASAGKVLPVLRDVGTPLVGGTAGGVAQEVVGNTMDPDSFSGRLANAALPMIAQGGSSYPFARMSTAGERASQTTKNLTPEQWDAAHQLAQKADALGAPITAAEAIQAVTGNNPGLQSLQRVTEQSKAGVRTIAPAMALRPGQNAALFGRMADTIHANEVSPDTIAGTLKMSAQGAIDAARGQGNAAAAPYYARTSNDPSVTIPSHNWNALTADPAVSWALEQTKRNPLLGVQGAQPGSLQWLDAAKKFLDSHANSQAQAGNNFPASQASKAATLITQTVDPLVPDYAKARAVIADNMRNVVEPMQASQVGKLSQSDNFVNQAGSMLPEKPMDVTPDVLKKTIGTIAAQNPTIVSRFLGQYLRGTFNEANQNLQNGENQFGGAKFAAKVAGNPMQAANLQQAVESAGRSPQGLLDALDVWRAQGTRPAVGSATTFNNGETGLLSGGLLSTVGKPLAAPGLLAEKMGYALSTQSLAEALHPSGLTVKKFQELARANGAYSPMEQAAFAALLKASSTTPQAAQEQ